MSDTDREALHLIGGPFDGGQVQLTETPLHIDIDGVRYKRLDDPDTGEFLGAYGTSHEAQVETSARIMTGERDQPDSELWQLLTDFARRVIANRDAVLRALGAKPVYASQEWVDADGVRSGWRTGYGYYTHSHEDAKRHLDWDRDNFDGEQFRLAAAWLTEWEDYTDE